MIDFNSFSVKELSDCLFKASDEYYNHSTSILTDEEFSTAKDILKEKDPNDIFLKMIGSKTNTEWIKATHSIPMGSLDKINTIPEFNKWYSNHPYKLISQPKLDGISIDIEYVNGNFYKAITRGDGIEGDDITDNVRKMKNVKLKLKDPITKSFRGEIVLLYEDFDEINNKLDLLNEKKFKNVRNAASGIAKRYDGKYAEYLTVLFYDVNGDFETEESKIAYINQYLKSVYYTPLDKMEDVVEVYNDYVEEERNELNYEIDGMVLKIDDIKIQESLGVSNKCPNGQIAWKFPNLRGKTIIKDIEWGLGTSGRLTPVAILEPIKLGGVTISRATLSNYDIYKSFNFKVGDLVIIERCNDVIPGVVENLGGGTLVIGYPLVCPHCGESTIIRDKFLKCENSNCSGNKTGILKKYADNVFLSNGVADKTIEVLFENDLISEPADFYKLTEGDLLNLPKFGFRKAEIVLGVINDGRKVKLEKFIDGLNFKNFGESRAKLLIENGYNTLDRILNIKREELLSIKGVGDSIADDFYISVKEKEDIIKNLLLEGIELVVEEKKCIEGGIFRGLSFCFTGAIQRVENGERLKRKDMEQIVIDNGGNVGSVKKGLMYLVQADPNSVSDKSTKAKELGIKILSEDEFFRMVGK